MNAPEQWDKNKLAQRLDEDFTHKTEFATHKRIHSKKVELLKVLERPEIELHTNANFIDQMETVLDINKRPFDSNYQRLVWARQRGSAYTSQGHQHGAKQMKQERPSCQSAFYYHRCSHLTINLLSESISSLLS
ncbi:hypothetical protein N9383_06495 [Granulosicoccus sp.]|nr:hypothetical protein [Granulosicoccus sp.]